MNTKKIIITILLIIFGIFAVSNKIYAADLAATIDVVADKTEVSVGDEVTFTLSIKDIANAEDNQITAMGGTITYDTDFFETISEASIEPSASADIKTDTGAFAFICKANSGTTTTIGTIKLKVKSTATGSGEVKFSQLESSDGETSAKSADKTIAISIKTASSSENPGSGSSGSDNSGSGNSGSDNSGSGNSGSENSGSGNSGSENSGSENTGSENSGSGNSGSDNSGSGNSGSGRSSSGNVGSENSDSGLETDSSTKTTTSSLPYTGNSYLLNSILIIVTAIAILSFIKYCKHKDIN